MNFFRNLLSSKSTGSAAVRSIGHSAKLEQARAIVEVQKTATETYRAALVKLHEAADAAHTELDNLDAEIERLMTRL